MLAWLPTSAEGKQLFRFGIASAIGIVVLITAVFALACLNLLNHRNDADLNQEARQLAAIVSGDETDAQLNTTLQKLSDSSHRLADGTQSRQAWVVSRNNIIRASTFPHPDENAGDQAANVLRAQWQSFRLAHATLDNGDELFLAQRQPLILPILIVVFECLGAGILLCGLILPLCIHVNSRWVRPLTRLLEAERPARKGAGKTGAAASDGEALDATSFPGGIVREIVERRNRRIERLAATDLEISRRSNEMEVLYDLSRELGLSREAPADIPSLALTYLSRAVDYDVGAMFIFTDETPVLTLRTRGPAHEVLLAEVDGQAINAFFERTGILIESETVRTNVLVADVRAPRVEGAIRLSHWVPVTLRDRTVGVMGVLFAASSVTASPVGKTLSVDDSRVVGIVAQNMSLSFEKAQMQRIEETQRFRNVLEHLAEGVVLLRQSGDWALATGTARSFHLEICGADARDTAEHSRNCPIGLLGADVFQSAAAISRELTRNDRTFILGGTFVRSSAAGEQGAVISIRDVTEERATQQQLFQASKLASLGELAAGVAHEVNNPLTGILGFTELLLSRDDLTGGLAEGLQEIHGLARRTNQITQDLLLFARVQREGGFRAVSLRDVVRDNLKLLETTYRSLHLELRTEFPKDPDGQEDRLLALGDQGKIQQIIMNLAQNAKDAITMASKGSRITFRGSRQKDEVVLEVEDDGPGIPERIRNKIFEPFFTTKPIGKGTGLGLAIVNRIVEEHKGKLIIDSAEGRGTTFRIVLPAAPPGTEEAVIPTAPVPKVMAASPPPLPPVSASEGARGNMVVLDDEETVLKFVSRTLQADGFSVFTTSDPEEAVRLIAEHTPQLLFLDFRMPNITGEEFYERMVALDGRWARRIVFLTGDSSGDDIQGFLKSTGAPALGKPIGVRDLRAFVDTKLQELGAAV